LSAPKGALSGGPLFVLVSLAALDVVLAGWALISPSTWFWAFHGVAAWDPEGLLRRCAGAWAAFAALELIAAFRFRREPEWLAVVAGARLADVLTDWTYLGFCADVTLFGRVALFAAGPMNLVLGIWLLRRYRAATARPA
jgi:hypothetical protein